MSRAERRIVPARPRLGRAVREAASDFYYNSWRFLAANVLVGAILVVVALGTVGGLAALLLLPLAAPPAAGTMRMATRLVRDGHTDFGELLTVLRRPWPTLGLALAQLALTAVLVVDVAIGLAWGGWVGTFLVVSALYGLAILWAWAAAAWPLVLDPVRDGEPIPARLRLALVLLVAAPLRVGGSLLVVGAVLGLATLAIAPAVTFAIGFAWLVLARFVLPAADRLEGRETIVVDE